MALYLAESRYSFGGANEHTVVIVVYFLRGKVETVSTQKFSEEFPDLADDFYNEIY